MELGQQWRNEKKTHRIDESLPSPHSTVNTYRNY